MKKKIKEECDKNPNEESCGIIYFAKKRTRIYPCYNRSENRKRMFSISHGDFLDCMKMGEILGIYHSHVDEDESFSDEDILFSEETRLPYFVYSLKTKRHLAYFPSGVDAESSSLRNFLSRVKRDFSVKGIKE